jgi:hypothetical protein
MEEGGENGLATEQQPTKNPRTLCKRQSACTIQVDGATYTIGG